MTSDQLDVIDQVAVVGPIFYGQAYSFLRQYDVLILVILILGFIFHLIYLVNESPRPLWDFAKSFVMVLVVLLTFYRPIVFNSVREYAPVSAERERALVSTFAPTGTLAPAMPVPSYWVNKLMDYGIRIAEKMVRKDNRFIIAQPANSAQMIATENALGDSQLNGSMAAWTNVVGPSLLQRYPAFAEALKSSSLLHRFLNPASASSPGVVGQESRAVSGLITSAGFDFPAVASTVVGMTAGNTALADWSLWTYAGGTLNAPALTPQTVSSPLPSSPPPGSSPSAIAAFTKGRTVLDGMSNSSARPVSENFTDFNSLYTTLGNARDVATAKTIGKSPEQIVLFGAACQANQAMCIEKVTSARDNVQIAARESEANFKAVGAAAAVGFFASIPAFITGGILQQAIPYVIGTVKALIYLAMPLVLIMSMWAGRSMLALTVCVQMFFFVGIWQIFYVFFVGWGDQLLNTTGSLMGYVFYQVVSVSILAGMGGTAYSLVMADLKRLGQQGGGTINKMGQAGDAAYKYSKGGISKIPTPTPTNTATPTIGSKLGGAIASQSNSSNSPPPGVNDQPGPNSWKPGKPF
jgi:hypothetical protein